MADNDLQIVFPESDDVLTCPKCKTANPLESNFCLNCGSRLLIPSGSNLKWYWIIFVVICAVGFIYYYYSRVIQLEPRPETPIQMSPAETPAPRKAEVPLSTAARLLRVGPLPVRRRLRTGRSRNRSGVSCVRTRCVGAKPGSGG